MPNIVTEKPFVLAAPAAQNAVDIFAGEWTTRFPPQAGVNSLGTAGHFDDERIRWADAELRKLGGAGFAGSSVLELGPMEGGHSYMLDRMGAREIVSVEANVRAYLKCLIAKEIVGMDRVHFLLGDAVPYLRALDRGFDAIAACGFLYHLVDPVEAIAHLARSTRQIFIWSMVFDPSIFIKQPTLVNSFGPALQAEHGGFKHTLHPHYYGEGLDYRKFLGGVQPSCCWMEQAEMIAALTHFGFTRQTTLEEDHLYGKAISIAAVRA